MTKTTLAKKKDPVWVLFDAENKILGRMSTFIAMRLQGKHRPEYTPNIDTGEHIIIINAEKVAISGRKEELKSYDFFSGWRGGLKTVSYKEMKEKHPERIVELAIKRMMPKGPMGKIMYGKLHVYVGSEHPHGAQKPEQVYQGDNQ